MKSRITVIAALCSTLVGCAVTPAGFSTSDGWKQFAAQTATPIAEEPSAVSLPIVLSFPVALMADAAKGDTFDVMLGKYNSAKFAQYFKPPGVPCAGGAVLNEQALVEAVAKSTFYAMDLYLQLKSQISRPVLLDPYAIYSDGVTITRKSLFPTTPAAANIDFFTYVNPAHVHACPTTFGSILTPIVNIRIWREMSPGTGGLLVTDRKVVEFLRDSEPSSVGSTAIGDVVALILGSNTDYKPTIDLFDKSVMSGRLPLATDRAILLPAPWLWVNFTEGGGLTCTNVSSVERGYYAEFMVPAARDAVRLSEGLDADRMILNTYRTELGPHADSGDTTPPLDSDSLRQIYNAEVRFGTKLAETFYKEYRKSQGCKAIGQVLTAQVAQGQAAVSASMMGAFSAGLQGGSGAANFIASTSADRARETKSMQHMSALSEDLMTAIASLQIEVATSFGSVVAKDLDDFRNKALALVASRPSK